MSNPTSINVVAGNNIYASELNTLRTDILQGNVITATRYITLPCICFRPVTYNSPPDCPYTYTGDDAYLKIGGASVSGGTYIAPIPNMRNGYTITNMLMRYYRTYGAYDSLYLYKASKAVHSTIIVTSLALSGSSGYQYSNVALSETLTDDKFYYLILVLTDGASADNALLHVRLTYTVDSVLP